MKKRKKINYAVIVSLIIVAGLLAIRILPLDFRLWNSSPRLGVSGTWHPYRWVPSDRIVYKFGYESDSSLDFSSLFKGRGSSQEKAERAPGLAQSLYTSIRGELVGKVIEKRGEILLIAYHLQNHAVTLSVNGQKAVEQEKVIRNDLYKEIYALVNSRGRIQSLRFDPDISNLSKGYFQALLACAQIVFPEKGNPDLIEWEIEEEDLGGSFIVHYQQDSFPSESQTSGKEPLMKNFRKIKTRYLPSFKKSRPGEAQPQKTILPEGILTVIFDFGDGHTLSINGSELQTIFLGKKKIGQVKNTIELSLVGKETIGEKELSLLRKASAEVERVSKAVSLSTNLSQKEVEVNLHRRQLGEATLETILTNLNEAEAAGGNYPDSLFLKFKAIIYLHPESCGPIGKILTSANPESLTMRILGGALIGIGHKEAQDALVSVIKARREDTNALLVLIPALDGIAEPTVETEKVIRKFAYESTNPDIKGTAQLALGSIARNLTITSPDRAEKIVREFIQQLKPSSTEKEIQQVLHVLGNTGSTLALSTIEKYIAHPTPFIRTAAMFALRWIESSEVDPLLAKGVSSDPDRLVRLEAANALKFRKITPQTYRAQREAFMKDEAVEVRIAVLHNFENAIEDFPEIKKLIKETAAKDSSKDVRKVANHIMARCQKEYFNTN